MLIPPLISAYLEYCYGCGKLQIIMNYIIICHHLADSHVNFAAENNYIQKIINVMDLVKLLNHLDYECDEATKEAEYQVLAPNVQEALEELWAKYYAAPKNNGHWTGEPCDSVWIPDDSVVPPNKSYSNIHGLSWGEIKNKHSFEGLRCDKGRFCFEDIALYTVTIQNFVELVDFPVRTALHEAAFAQLAKDLGISVEEVKAIKESRNDQTPMGQKNLVWHEDVDCSTLYLVPQEIHGNIPHFGGIAMCQILKRYNLLN